MHGIKRRHGGVAARRTSLNRGIVSAPGQVDQGEMKSRLPHTRVRPFWAAACLVLAFGLLLGLSSSPASARSMGRTKMIITGTSPAQPAGGQTFTMKFQLTVAGSPIHMANAACYATAGGKLAPLLRQGTDGTTGTCTWSVPSGASGKTFDGILAAQKDNGTWFYYGFDLPIS